MARLSESEVVLAALGAGGTGAWFNPVQVQILMFLVDRRNAPDTGGPHFDFEPRDAGPCSMSVDQVLEGLAESGELVIDDRGPFQKILLSEAGRSRGQEARQGMRRSASRDMVKTTRWVLAQGFWDLIVAIHRSFPEMTVNCQIPLEVIASSGRRSGRRMHPFLKGMASAFDIWPQLDQPFPDLSPAERDAIAIAGDWRAIGDDLRAVIGRMESTPRVMKSGENSPSAPSSEGADLGDGRGPQPNGGPGQRVISTEQNQSGVEAQIFSGPLPLPEVLGRCGATVPSAAEFIVTTSRDEVKFRQRLAARGRVFGFIIAMTSIVGGIGLIALDKQVVGAATTITAIVALTALFAHTSPNWPDLREIRGVGGPDGRRSR